jgi:hypothetical protein
MGRPYLFWMAGSPIGTRVLSNTRLLAFQVSIGATWPQQEKTTKESPPGWQWLAPDSQTAPPHILHFETLQPGTIAVEAC